MQPTLCSRCKKNIATVFITRMEGDKTVNEGLCLKCAKSLGLPQVNEMMQRMGITDEDLDNLNNEMMQAMDSIENVEDLPGGEDDEEAGKTATFPFLNRLFNNGGELAPKEDVPTEDGSRREKKEGKPNGKRKFLEGYCISLNRKAKEGKLDPVIGRAEEIERVIQILNRRQKNNPCLIGEPGVGKTAIAEGLAQRIVAGDVPFKLRDKEVYLLDLTALVAGTQFRGQFEQRMKGLIDEVKKLGNIILMIDEIHNIVGAGDAEGSMNAANILKPALSRGRDPGHRRHHLQRIPQVHREGQRSGTPVPAGDGERALHRGLHQDPQGSGSQLRGVSRCQDLRRHPASGGAAERAVHHRPLSAG